MKVRFSIAFLALANPSWLAGDVLSYQWRTVSAGSDSGLGSMQFSPDGEWRLHLEAPEPPGQYGYYLARRWQITPATRIGVPEPHWGVEDLAFSPDSRRLLYLRNLEEFGERMELRSAALEDVPAGGARIGPENPDDGILDFSTTPDGQRVLFRAWSSGAVVSLFSAPIDGSGPPVRLHPAQPAGRTVERYVISPDGLRVVFRADFAAEDNFGLWSAPIDGSGPLVRLSPPPVPGGYGVEALPPFFVAGNQAFYVGEFAAEGGRELWRRPVDASIPAVRLSPDGTSLTGVLGFSVASQSGRVIFAARLTDPSPIALYSVPWTGSAPQAIQLSPATAHSNPLRQWNLSKDGTRLLFAGFYGSPEVVELFSVPVEGPSSAAVRLTLATPPGQGQSEAPYFESSQDSARVIVSGLYGDPPVFGLWSAPADGPASSSVRLDLIGAEFAGADPIGFTGDGLRFLFRQVRELPDNGPYVEELWSAVVEGAPSPTRLHSQMTASPQRAHSVAPGLDGRVYFAAALDGSNYFLDELWVNQAASPESGPLRLHPPSSGGELRSVPVLSPDGLGVLFIADLGPGGERFVWLADAVVFRADFDEEGDTTEWSMTYP